jgi:hypothetical protein
MIEVFAAVLSLSCPPLPGVDSLWSNPNVRTVAFGATYGSNEAPALFADVVCHAAQRGPVSVALDQPEPLQGAIERYVREGTRAARNTLISAPAWRTRMPDGATSQATLDLLARLHTLRMAGADISIATVPGIEPPWSQDAWARSIAASWDHASRGGSRLVLASVGRNEARKTVYSIPQGRFRPAAANLPAGATLSILIVGEGGTAWNCEAADDCKPHAVLPYPAVPRGLVLRSLEDGAYDGLASTGGPWTASPPVKR